MAAVSNAARYRTVAVSTSSPGEVLIMLYEGLLRFLNDAREAMKTGNRARAGERISRAHAILEELTVALNPKHAPELCSNLEGLYSFCMNHLIEANAHQDPVRIGNVIRFLSPIAEAWRTVVRKKPVPATPQAR